MSTRSAGNINKSRNLRSRTNPKASPNEATSKKATKAQIKIRKEGKKNEGKLSNRTAIKPLFNPLAGP